MLVMHELFLDGLDRADDHALDLEEAFPDCGLPEPGQQKYLEFVEVPLSAQIFVVLVCVLLDCHVGQVRDWSAAYIGS